MSYPYYIDRDSERVQGALPIGTRVRGDWGAMHPNWYGEVTGYDPEHGNLIKWDGEDHNGGYYEIRLTRSANGSPIGVWQDKV